MKEIEDDFEFSSSYGGSSFKVLNHYSLLNPPATIRFRNSKIHVYGENFENQFIIQETPGYSSNDNLVKESIDSLDSRYSEGNNNMSIMIKHQSSISFATWLRHTFYAFTAFIVSTFLFIACMDFTFSIFLHSDLVDRPSTIRSIIRSLLGLPYFCCSTAWIMTFCQAFVVDTYQRNAHLRRVMHGSDVLLEWFLAGTFFIAPVLTAIISLLMRSKNWWANVLWVWIAGVFVSLLSFIVTVVTHEMVLCYEVMIQNNLIPFLTETSREKPVKRWLRMVKAAIELRQIERYSAIRNDLYLLSGHRDPPGRRGFSDNPNVNPFRSTTSICSNLGLRVLSKFCYTKPISPHKIYTTDEVLEHLPYQTRQNWSLEDLLSNGLFHNVVKNVRFQNGTHNSPTGLTKPQVLSNIVFYYIYNLIMVLLLTSLVIYGTGSYRLLALALVIFIVPKIPELKTLLKFREICDKMFCDNNGSSTIFYLKEQVLLAKPNSKFCWAMFWLEFAFMFLFPIVNLIVQKNKRVAAVFTVTSIFTALRYYVNIGVITRNLGPISDIRLRDRYTTNPVGEDETRRECAISLNDEARLNIRACIAENLKKVTCNPSFHGWRRFYTYWFAFIGIFSIYVLVNGDDKTYYFGIKFVDGFYYPPQPDQALYPSCKLGSGYSFSSSDEGSTDLGDYVLFSNLAYTHPRESKYVLDSYFGEGKVVDEYEYVNEYRKRTGNENFPVSYKLFSYETDEGRVGIVSIRGSFSLYDWLNNFQSWTKPVMFQIARSVLPLGFMWNDIFPRLCSVIGMLETEMRGDVHYYKYTTEFVKHLKDIGKYQTLRITGHSLGGGLAIITGAQTNTNTVAISGVNALIARDALDPPISPDDIDLHTLNVAPRLDLIPRLDDQGALIQNIACRVSNFAPLDCHSSFRTQCEMAYACGSDGRPILCLCTEMYGYPKPIQNGTETWEEACEGFFLMNPPGTQIPDSLGFLV